jgi:soluble lytic murein transglycosylase-like protein
VRLRTSILLGIALAASCFARETVYLTSGFSITADSHTQVDGLCVLHVGSGTLEYPLEQIAGIVPLADAPVRQSLPAAIGKPQSVLVAAAQREGVDELFVRSVAKVESGLRQEAVSKKGALGLMQLMPGTAAELGVDPRKADENATGGARYLRTLLEQYQYNPVLALAAYNAGPHAVTKYRGLPPYYETRTYVVRVLREYERQLRAAGINPAGRNGSDVAPQRVKSSSAIN